MTLKLSGSSNRKEFVRCYKCKKKFSWLNAYEEDVEIGTYYCLCRSCRLKIEKEFEE